MDKIISSRAEEGCEWRRVAAAALLNSAASGRHYNQKLISGCQQTSSHDSLIFDVDRGPLLDKKRQHRSVPPPCSKVKRRPTPEERSQLHETKQTAGWSQNWLSWTLTEAPRVASNLTASKCPWAAAQCNGCCSLMMDDEELGKRNNVNS